MNLVTKAGAALADMFSDEDDPSEPGYDPVQLGGAVLITIVAMGALYWLLWTLLVYEGGIFMKLRAAALLAFTNTRLTDLGYEGAPYAMGEFEGWLGNVLALALTFYVARVLRQLYRNPWKPTAG
jgi:hypothetical protein